MWPDPDRTHKAARIVKAPPEAIYEAFIRPDALVRWLPPAGAQGEIEIFEAREGGRLRMTLTFGSAPGKSSRNKDIVEGRFVTLWPAERIGLSVTFESDNPAFAGTMVMTWVLTRASDGTVVAITAEDVPAGISRGDHERGMASTLANLARFIEQSASAPG